MVLRQGRELDNLLLEQNIAPIMFAYHCVTRLALNYSTNTRLGC